jgi:DNA-binding SARP family transcriptional activator
MPAAVLSVNLFGPTLFRRDGRPYPLGLKGTTLKLVWYLVSRAGQELRRECVADQFWPSSSAERQRSALNSAIWRIGKKLPRHPDLKLYATDTTLCLNIGRTVPVDTRDLCALVREACGSGMVPECAERLAAALYASDAPFMDGLDADWTLAERERLSSIRARGMIALMHWHGDNRAYEEALQIGRRLLCEDPLRESVQIDMMWLYVLNGQRPRAIRQYQSFAAFLRDELAIEPMVETRALYDHIRDGLDTASDGAAGPAPAPRGHDARARFAMVLAAVEKSRHDFYQQIRTSPG